MAMKTSQICSAIVVNGCLDPISKELVLPLARTCVTSTLSLTRIESSLSLCNSVVLISSAFLIMFRASPILLPASALAAPSKEPISRFAKATGDFSPA